MSSLQSVMGEDKKGLDTAWICSYCALYVGLSSKETTACYAGPLLTRYLPELLAEGASWIPCAPDVRLRLLVGLTERRGGMLPCLVCLRP
jgi:hypothetical protein